MTLYLDVANTAYSSRLRCTTVLAFVTSRIEYCNSVLRRASAVHIQPMQNVLNAAARIVLCQ